MRWYHTPASLRRMLPDFSDRCWRCGEEEGHLLHLFWSCTKIKPFWNTKLNFYQTLLIVRSHMDRRSSSSTTTHFLPTHTRDRSYHTY